MSTPKAESDKLRERVVVASILAAILADPSAVLPSSLSRVLDFPHGWTSPECGPIAAAIRKARNNGGCTLVSIAEYLDPALVGHLSQLATEDGNVLPLGLAEIEAEPLLAAIRKRRVIAELGEAWQEASQHPEQALSIADHAREALSQITGETKSQADLLTERQFNPTIEPPPLRAIYKLCGHPISTPGNIATITSTIKTGKSAVIGAMLAAAMTTNNSDADLFGFSSANPNGARLLHFDSEQAPDDFWHCNRRALNRAGLEIPPAWFHSFCFTGLGASRALEHFREAVKQAAKEGPLHSIFLDGAADFVSDVNDAAESNSFVAMLHDTAIKHDCPLIVVIHFNPGTEKSRGHLGSQLERKAETNLRLDKTGGVTTIWSDKQRRAPIPKDCGPCFQWSDEAGMHVTVTNAQTSKLQEEKEMLEALAGDVFKDHPSMHYSQIVSTVKTLLMVSQKTAERRVGRMVNLGVVIKSVAGLYTPST